MRLPSFLSTKLTSLAICSFLPLNTMLSNNYTFAEDNVKQSLNLANRKVNDFIKVQDINSILNNTVNSGLNIREMGIPRGNFTLKTFNLMGGYTFLNFGYVLGLSKKAGEVNDFKKSDYPRGNLYLDFAFRNFISKKAYFNAGVGLKAGRLLEDQRLDWKKQISPSVNIFGGVKFDDTEVTVQYDSGKSIKKYLFSCLSDNRALEGFTASIFHNNSKIKLLNINFQIGYNNYLNSSKNSEKNSLYVLGRYNLKGLFSFIDPRINNWFAVELGGAYNFNEGLIFTPIFSLGLLKDNSLNKVQNAYYMVDGIFKLNSIEYSFKNVTGIEFKNVSGIEGEEKINTEPSFNFFNRDNTSAQNSPTQQTSSNDNTSS